MQRAVANDGTATMIDVQHRCKRHVDAVCAQLRAHQVAQRCGDPACEQNVAIPQVAKPSHRRQPGKTVAKALHPTAFVINGNQQRWIAQRVNLAA